MIQHSQRSKQVWALVFVAALCGVPVGAKAAQPPGMVLNSPIDLAPPSTCGPKIFCPPADTKRVESKVCDFGLYVNGTCVGNAPVGARATDTKRVERVDCTDGWCTLCFVGGDCTTGTPAEIASKGPYQLATTEPPPQVMWTPPPDTLHRTRCLPVGADHIMDCWVEGKR